MDGPSANPLILRKGNFDVNRSLCGLYVNRSLTKAPPDASFFTWIFPQESLVDIETSLGLSLVWNSDQTGRPQKKDRTMKDEPGERQTQKFSVTLDTVRPGQGANAQEDACFCPRADSPPAPTADPATSWRSGGELLTSGLVLKMTRLSVSQLGRCHVQDPAEQFRRGWGIHGWPKTLLNPNQIERFGRHFRGKC